MMDYLNLWHIAGGTDVEMNQNLQYWDYDLWSFFFRGNADGPDGFFLPLFRSREKISGLRLPSGNLTVCY